MSLPLGARRGLPSTAVETPSVAHGLFLSLESRCPKLKLQALDQLQHRFFLSLKPEFSIRLLRARAGDLLCSDFMEFTPRQARFHTVSSSSASQGRRSPGRQGIPARRPICCCPALQGPRRLFDNKHPELEAVQQSQSQTGRASGPESYRRGCRRRRQHQQFSATLRLFLPCFSTLHTGQGQSRAKNNQSVSSSSTRSF